MSSSLELPKNVSYFQIGKVELDSVKLSLRLELVNPINQKLTVLEFYEVALFSISKTPEDTEGYYLIGDITLTSTSDPESLLKELGYGFKELKTDLRKNFVHLHIEGDICLDIVSGSQTISEE